MNNSYEDILYLPHHVSAFRPRMSMTDRAAQFSPFAALTGYDAAIQETGRLTDELIELDIDGMTMLNEKIRVLAEQVEEQPQITVTYFVPDERKKGGAYVRTGGRAKKIDPHEQVMVLEDGTKIPFRYISDIQGEMLRQD